MSFFRSWSSIRVAIWVIFVADTHANSRCLQKELLFHAAVETSGTEVDSALVRTPQGLFRLIVFSFTSLALWLEPDCLVLFSLDVSFLELSLFNDLVMLVAT